MKLWTAMALRITFSTYIVYSSQTATLAKIVRSKSHPKWLFSVFLSNKSWKEKNMPCSFKKPKHWEWRACIVCPTDAQAWAQEKTKALRQSREASWWPSRWGEFSHEICQFSGRSFVPPWGGVPAVCFNSCWWRWCLGWTSDLCRLCCGSSSSAVLTGVVVFGSETSRLFFHEAERMYCIVLTRKDWGFG